MRTLNTTTLDNMESYIIDYQKRKGKSPSFREVMKALNMSSLNLVRTYILALENSGRIERTRLGNIDMLPKLRPSGVAITPIVGSIACGKPVDAVEQIEESVTLPRAIFGGGDLFILHTHGDSMIDIGIKHGDLVVIRKQNTAENGDIIVAMMNGETTLKRFYKRNGKVVLHPENKEMKDIIVTALYNLGYILIFPGFLFCFFAGLLLCGIDRKLVAKMQKRVGPPVLQPFYDFFKLCGKECIVPAAASRTMFLMAPLVGLAALVVIQLFIPVFTFTAFSQVADIIVILYLLLIPAMSAMLGGAASGSPYAGVGLSREMVTIISCELPLVLVLLSVAKTVGDAMGTGLCFSLTDIALYQAANGSLILKASMIPAAAAMLLIIPGETGNHPFDAAEAETEICEGMLAEYSGAPLGVYKLNHAIKMLTLTSLFVALFLGGIGGGIEKLVALIGLTGGAAAGMTMLLGIVILLLLCIALTAVSISFVHAITARLKIEQIFKYYWTVVSGLALISLVLAWYGM